MSRLPVVALIATAVAAGCGSSPKHMSAPISTQSSTATTATDTGPGALQSGHANAAGLAKQG